MGNEISEERLDEFEHLARTKTQGVGQPQMPTPDELGAMVDELRRLREELEWLRQWPGELITFADGMTHEVISLEEQTRWRDVEDEMPDLHCEVQLVVVMAEGNQQLEE